MRKVTILLLLVLLVFPSMVKAAPEKPNIAVLYYDNLNSHKTIKSQSKSFYINKITEKFSQDYAITFDDQNIVRLNNAGITDPTTAERGDIIPVFKDDNLAYLIIIDMMPRIKFNGKTTSSQYLKIIDVINNKSLYNGKFQYPSRYAASMGHTEELYKQNEEVLIRLLPSTK